MSRRNSRTIDRNIEILVQSNIHASFSYHEGGVDLELARIGDDDYLTFGELKRMSSGSNKSILKRMYLLIVDVDDDEVTVDDVIKQLKLEKEYNAAKRILGKDTIEVGDFKDFVRDSSLKELEKAFEVEDLREVLVESAIELHKERVIDIDRINTALKACGIDDSQMFDFLNDIEATK